MRISDDHVVQLTDDKLVLKEDSTGIEIVWPADWAKIAGWIDELAEVNAGGVHYVHDRPVPEFLHAPRPSIRLTSGQLARFAFAAGYFYRSWVN